MAGNPFAGSSNGTNPFGGSTSSKKKSDDGFLGLGFGPSLHSIYKGVTEAPGVLADTASGLATGLLSTAYNTGAAGVNAIDYGLAKAVGDQNAARGYAGQLHTAAHNIGQQEVGMVTGASTALGDVADVGALRFIPGVTDLENSVGFNPGGAIRGVVGTGLADVGGIAAGKLNANPLTPDNPQNVATLQYMGTHEGYGFNEGTPSQRIKEGGYLRTGLADAGNLAIVAGATTPLLTQGAELADAQGFGTAAKILSKAAGASHVAEHPFKNTIGRPIAPLTRAGFAAHIQSLITPAHDDGTNAADSTHVPGVEGWNYDPVVGNYYDQYGHAAGMQFPGEVDKTRTMPPELGQQIADAYQSKPTDINQLPPEEAAAAKASYDAFIPQVHSQYEFLTKPESEGGMGVTVEKVDRANNPYARPDGSTDFNKMLTDIQQNKHLYVDKTSEAEKHPYMTAAQNDEFRAVHDAFGHSRAGNDFGPNGEEVAFQHHAPMFSPEAQGALAMETRGQNATLNFSRDNQARAAAGEPKQFDVQRVGLLPPEMSHPDYTKQGPVIPPEHPEAVPAHSAAEAAAYTPAHEVPNMPHTPEGHVAHTTEEMSPTAHENTARSASAIPEWATKAVSHLNSNGPIVKALSKMEVTRMGRVVRTVARELERGGIEIPRRAAMNEPFMKTVRDAVQTLQAQNKHLQPEEASRMIGQAVTDRLTGADKLEGGPGHHVLLPHNMRTPEIMDAIDRAESQYKDFSEKTKEGLLASETYGERGIPEEGVAEETKQIKKLTRQISYLTKQADKAGRRVPREVIQLRAEKARLEERIAISGDRISRYQATRNAAAEALEALRGHVAPREDQVRSNPSTEGTLPGTAGEPIPMPKEQSAAQMVRNTPVAPNEDLAALKEQLARMVARRAELPTEAAARNGTSVVSSQMHQEITELDRNIAEARQTIRDSAVHEPARDIQNRGINLAYSARDIADATQRIADETKRKADLEAQSAELQRRIDAGETRSAGQKSTYEKILAKRTQQLNKAIETLPVSHWPRELQPAGRAFMRMVEDAKNDPELARLVGDAEPTYKSFLQHANALGMDPRYVADMTPDQVRAQMQVRPGMTVGETMVSGARKEYNARLDNANARDNSIEAFLAARTQMHQEIVQNMMAGYIRDNFGIPVHKGDVISNELAGFDPSAKFHLEPRETAGHWTAPADGYVIPRALAAGINRANKDYGHWIQNANKFITNPWRNAVITASPQFYVNHTIGHAVLATVEGVHLQDWANAWRSYRESKSGAAGPENLYNRFSGESAVGQGTAKEPTLETPGGVRDAMERTEGSKAVAGGHAVAAKLHAATNLVDSLARTATYIAKKDKGYSDTEALNKAYSNLVDYNDMSPFEQQIVRAVVPFYSFQKQIFKIALKLPIDHPVVLGIAANLGRINQQQLSDRFGVNFPQGYSGMIDAGGGSTINTHGINPFKDATSLASLDGIVQALNPAIAIALRSGLNAPSGGYSNGKKVDRYGNLVDDVNPLDELKDEASFLPLVSGSSALMGNGKGPVRGPLAKFGLNTYDKAEMDKLVARIKGSQSAAASGSPYPKKSGSSGNPFG